MSETLDSFTEKPNFFVKNLKRKIQFHAILSVKLGLRLTHTSVRLSNN